MSTKQKRWTEDVWSLYSLLRELAIHVTDQDVRRVISEGIPELTDSEFDGWNRGTTYYTLTIHVPIYLYAALDREMEEVEEKILKIVRRLQRNESNDFISKLVVNPTTATVNRSIPPQESPY